MFSDVLVRKFTSSLLIIVTMVSVCVSPAAFATDEILPGADLTNAFSTTALMNEPSESGACSSLVARLAPYAQKAAAKMKRYIVRPRDLKELVFQKSDTEGAMPIMGETVVGVAGIPVTESVTGYYLVRDYGLRAGLTMLGIDYVITAIGVVPREFWNRYFIRLEDKNPTLKYVAQGVLMTTFETLFRLASNAELTGRLVFTAKDAADILSAMILGLSAKTTVLQGIFKWKKIGEKMGPAEAKRRRVLAAWMQFIFNFVNSPITTKTVLADHWLNYWLIGFGAMTVAGIAMQAQPRIIDFSVRNVARAKAKLADVWRRVGKRPDNITSSNLVLDSDDGSILQK